MQVASVFSVFSLSNISLEVTKAQADCVFNFLPQGWRFAQLQIPPNGNHPSTLLSALDSSKTDINIFLDIDCIPLSQQALQFLVEKVAERGNTGLAGAVQRSNHVNNNKHLYVGPFCMAFSKKYYHDLGNPTFNETERGDVGEELTYRWSEMSGRPLALSVNPHRYSSNIQFLWPTNVVQPLWELDLGYQFGIGTTYGLNKDVSMFYHHFNARDSQTHSGFIAKCREILAKKVA